MSDPLDALRAQAAAALFPTEGVLEAPGLAAPVIGHPRPPRRPHDRGRLARGPLVRPGPRHRRRATRPARSHAARRHRPPLRALRRTDLRGRPVRAARSACTWRETAVAATWTEEDHAMHARFRDGVRAWIDVAPAPPLEYQLLGGAPDLPLDPGRLGGGVRLPGVEPVEQPGPGAPPRRDRRRLGPDAVNVLVPPSAGGPALGSNAWAVSGAHTGTGLPLLANDPHLLALQPGRVAPPRARRTGLPRAGPRAHVQPGDRPGRVGATTRGAPRTRAGTSRTSSRSPTRT